MKQQRNDVITWSLTLICRVFQYKLPRAIKNHKCWKFIDLCSKTDKIPCKLTFFQFFENGSVYFLFIFNIDSFNTYKTILLYQIQSDNLWRRRRRMRKTMFCSAASIHSKFRILISRLNGEDAMFHISRRSVLNFSITWLVDVVAWDRYFACWDKSEQNVYSTIRRSQHKETCKI